jgi:dTDP-3-amino-3,4,6-trideoxy-alpha-D-glucose transaminase
VTTATDDTRVPFVDLVAERRQLGSVVDEAVRRVLDSGWFILGEELKAFEKEFATYCGARHAVGVGSGTDALAIAVRACGIGPGHEVVLPSHTFIATALAVASAGATPVLVDVDPTTYTIDPHRVAQALTPRTRAIIAVHLYGQPADMDALLAIARENGLRVIEDAAQAHGARYKGRRTGVLGDLACFSFYPTKNLAAYGDAGAIVTDDAGIAAACLMLRNYGQTRRYRHETLGYNSRLDELQSAVLRAKLPFLDRWNDHRRRAAHAYHRTLEQHVAVPVTAPEREHVYHLYVVRRRGRDELMRELAKRGIDTLVHYPIPIHEQPVAAALGVQARDLPVTERLAREVLSLPIFPTITDAQVDYVAASVVRHVEDIGA